MSRSKWPYLILLLVLGAALVAVSAHSDIENSQDRDIKTEETENQNNEEANNAFVWKDDSVKKGENVTNANEKLWNGRDEEQSQNDGDTQGTFNHQRNGNLTLYDNRENNDSGDSDGIENTPSRVFHSEEGDFADVDGDEELGYWLQDEIVEQHILEDGKEDEKKDEANKPDDVVDNQEVNGDDEDLFGGSFRPNSVGPDGKNLYGEDDLYYGDFDDEDEDEDDDDEDEDEDDDDEDENDDANPDEDGDGNGKQSHAHRATQSRNEVDKQYEGKNKLQDILNFYRFRKFEPKVSPKDGEAPTSSNDDHKQKLDEIRAALRAQIFGRRRGEMENVLQDNINSLNRDGIDNDTLNMHYSAKRAIIREYATSNLGIALLVGTAFVMMGSLMYALNRQRGPILPLHV